MTSTRTRGRKGLRLLLGLIAVLVGVLVLVGNLVAVLLRTDAVESYLHKDALPRLSERIGRQVTVGEVHVSLFPVPSAKISDVRVAGLRPDRPLLAAPRVEARIALWPLIHSFGKEIELKSIELQKPELDLVRLPDGTWDYQTVLSRLKKPQPHRRSKAKREWGITRVAVVDGLGRVVDLSAPGGKAVAVLNHLDLEARHIQPGKRLTMKLSAAVQSEAPNLNARVSVDPLPASMAAIGPGKWPVVKGRVELRDAPVGTLRNLLPAGITESFTGGTVRIQSNIATEGGRYEARGKVTATRLELRGHPVDVSLPFTASIDPANRRDVRLELTDIALKGPGIDLGGTASLQGTDRFQFALAGPVLDMNILREALPQRHEGPAKEKTTLLSPPARRKIATLVGNGTVKLDRLINGKLIANDVVAEATLRGGELTLNEAKANFYHGKVDASGTRVDLAQAKPSWHLKATVSGVQLGEAMQQMGGKAPLSGRLASQLNLEGAGVRWKAIRNDVSGSGEVRLRDADLTSSNLGELIARDLLMGIEKLGYGTTTTRSLPRDTTLREEVQAKFDVRNGWMTLRQPMRLETPFGLITVGGRIGLDEQLDLSGTVDLDPPFIAEITGNRINPPGSVRLPIQIKGTLHDPRIEGITPEAVARSVVHPGHEERKLAKRLGNILHGK